MTRSEKFRRDPRGRKTRADIYAMLAERIDDLKNHLGGLPKPIEAEGMWGDIWHHEVHNSTAIEGNTLVLREVELLLREGRAVGNKRLSEYLEVRGYADAAEWVYAHAQEPGGWTEGQLLSLAEVRHAHQLTVAPVWEIDPHPDATPQERAGNFRQHDIQEFPTGMKPPPWTEVPPLMHDWVATVNTLPADARPFPEALAARHAEFERVHPFLDGNGRTGRLLTNLVLIRLGYPPAIIQKRDRSRYLAALRKADVGDAGPLGEVLARNILDTLDRYIVPAVAGPIRLVPLTALADAGIKPSALREAALRGRLRASRDDRGRWLSTRRWVEEYQQSRTPRGRKPKS